jgi:hypothetical protein
MLRDVAMEKEEDQDAWWSRTWEERRDQIEAAVGSVQDEVVSFSWRRAPRIPGACALTIPPSPDVARRQEWLYLSMGVSQPLSESQVRACRTRGENRSGFGYELGVLTSEAALWAPELLYELITYFTEPAASPLGSGDRIAFGLYAVHGVRHVFVGALGDIEPIGELRGLLVWPYRQRPHFLTSTGKADLFIATGITEAEWSLARETSSQHLVLLLARCGIGQTTDLARPCVSRSVEAMAAWSEIQKLTDQEAWNLAIAAPGHDHEPVASRRA